MAQQLIDVGRLAQRTSGAKINSNCTELYSRAHRIDVTATANSTLVIPANYIIEHVVFQNTTANSVTGGVKIGTTNGGTEVVAAQSVPANALDHVKAADVQKRIFSLTAPTTLYLQAVTAWNSASVNFRVILRKVF